MLRKVLVAAVCLAFALCTGMGCKKEESPKAPTSIGDVVDEGKEAVKEVEKEAEGAIDEAKKAADKIAE